MKNLKKKLNNEGGFTLIEMLIVVAIIAILVAIAIPMVNKALEKSREATDQANERAALGVAITEVLSEYKLGGTAIADDADSVTAYYVVTNNRGELKAGTTKPDEGCAYGKGTKMGDIKSDNAGKGIKVTYTKATDTEDEKFEVTWE